jgi:CheY-like chemotaxis protein
MDESRKKILLCEDNADLQELLAIAVGYLGYDVVVAVNGEEAVELACERQPDLILMDVGLPKLNGVEATVRIKHNYKTRQIPIVMLTALRMCPDIIRALESGAAEILQKPVTLPRIQEVLRKYLPAEEKLSEAEISATQDRFQRAHQ